MNSWRVVLQLEGGGLPASCTRYDLTGTALPARVSVVACDPLAAAAARAVHDEMDLQTRGLGAQADPCGGPQGQACLTWDEPSCQQVLVLVIGSTPLAPMFETMAADWLARTLNGSVITALLPHLTHAAVFPPQFSVLGRCNAAPWGGSPLALADFAVQAALLDEKRGVFVSYLRRESAAAAEQIHDALTHAGYRAFLDRFNGTPGRLFPHELSEAMASMGLVVLLETPSLLASHWTLWEAAFARRYRLGPIAINFGNAPQLPRTMDRLVVAEDPSVKLRTAAVDDCVAFVNEHALAKQVARHAYYETLVRLAARSKGGTVTIRSGILELSDAALTPRGSALVNGRPGGLSSIRRLFQAPLTGSRILAGEHQHLAPRAREDLRWLAAIAGVTLSGQASVYRAVRRIL